MCAFISAVMVVIGTAGAASEAFFGFDGRRPRRPFRLSVRTTVNGRCLVCFDVDLCDKLRLTFFDHTDAKAFLESTRLAAIASSLVHSAVLVAQTGVL